MLQETAVVFVLIFCVVGAALACRLVRLIRRKDWGKHFLWHSSAAGAAHDVHGIYGGNLAGVVLYSHVRRSGLVPAGLFLAIGQQPGGRNSL